MHHLLTAKVAMLMHDEDYIALITRQFKKFLWKKYSYHQKLNKGKFGKHRKVASNVICFECTKLEHVKADCPTLNVHPSMEKGEEKAKFKKGKRVRKAFWADSASDSSETEAEEETTNLCLMARDDLHQSDEEEVCELTYEKLFDIFEKIHSSYRKFKKVHDSLKFEFLNLKKKA
ncbi:hypothetical protein M5K25_008335 [Dendrobium thyrsiflorum]|uniref:CCHC-type domain-containing protein n=1 Tax=Dendrobium thyrsiflorum TaxID=117978 RepID=A0ABD0VF46_DENTH